MNEDYVFDFEQEIMDQYAAQREDVIDWDDCSQGSTDVESYDP